MSDHIFIGSFLIMLLFVTLENYLYFAIVLPALKEDGLDGSIKFKPSEQVKQVDLYIVLHAADVPCRWQYKLLSHNRIITFFALIAGVSMLVTNML
jgi:hypothetical protein